MEEYEDPTAQEKLKELSDGELVDLTRESIRLRKEDNRYNLGGPDFKKLVPNEAMIAAAAPSAFMPPCPLCRRLRGSRASGRLHQQCHQKHR